MSDSLTDFFEDLSRELKAKGITSQPDDIRKFLKDLGAPFRALREFKNESLEDVAKGTGMDLKRIESIEEGTCACYLDEIRTLLVYFNASTEGVDRIMKAWAIGKIDRESIFGEEEE